MADQKLPLGFTEEDVTLLVQGAQKHLSDRTIGPAPEDDEELFYGTDQRDDRPGGTEPEPAG